MPLLGAAAVAMWWDMAPEPRSEFEHWHSHEHFPERMSVPGFRRGSRWASDEGGEGVFVLYELESFGTLTSPDYLGRLNDPTPWSMRMMPHHRKMVRSQCRVLDSFGGGVARFMATIRFSPAPGGAQALHDHLKCRLAGLPTLPGLTGAHLLRTETPDAPPTAEQKIRGGDAVADWVLLVSGYDAGAVGKVATTEFGDEVLQGAGVLPSSVTARYRLSHTLTPGDL